MKAEAPESKESLYSNADDSSVQQNDKEDDEKKRFASKGPLSTLFSLSVGPVVYNTGISIHDAVNLMMIARACKGNSLQVVGFSSLIQYLCMCTIVYFKQAVIAKIASLLGAGQKAEAGQVITDLFRIAFIALGFVALLFYYISLPMLKFMGCDDQTSLDAREYLLPILASMPFISLFQLSNGFIQSQGRSTLCGVLQFVGFALNCGILAPILLFAVKVPLKYAGVSFALSQSIPGVIMTYLIFAGKFNIHPDKSMFCKCISKETLHALLLGTPFILNILAGALPPMVLLSYMMKAATAAGNASIIASVFSVYLKLQSAINSVSIGINQGLMVSGSFARGANDPMRIVKLFYCSCIVTFIYHCCWIPLMETRPDLVAQIWITDPDELEYSRTFLKIPFYTNCLIPLADATVNFLLAAGKPVIAMIPSFFKAGVILAATFAFYYTDKENPMRMMYTYTTCDVSNLLLCAGFAIYNILSLKKSHQNVLNQSLLEKEPL